MNHILAREAVRAGDLRFTHAAPFEFTAFLEEARPGGIVNRSVHPAAAQKVTVRGIYIASTSCRVMSPVTILTLPAKLCMQ